MVHIRAVLGGLDAIAVARRWGVPVQPVRAWERWRARPSAF